MDKKNNDDIDLMKKEIIKLKKINSALMGRVERSINDNSNAFSLFEGNILLTAQVKERTSELELITNELADERNKLSRIIYALPGKIIIFDKNYQISESFAGKLETKNTSYICENNNANFNTEFINAIEKAQKKISHPEQVVHFDYLNTHKEIERFYSCSITAINENQYVLFILDTTEKYLQENIIKSQEAQIIQASKLSALGEMAGGIAHEINTPLGTITLLANQIKSLKKRENPPMDKIEELTDKIQATVKKISSIVRGLKQISRDGTLEELKPCNLMSIINDALDLCQQRFRSNGVELFLENLNDTYVQAKQVQLSQVILNLLNNAFHVARQDNDGWIKVLCKDMGPTVRLYVIDSGKGIEPSILDKVFNPFFTTKEVGEGTGLGMSISKQIIDEHKGKLCYELYEGNTSFYIEVNKSENELIAI